MTFKPPRHACLFIVASSHLYRVTERPWLADKLFCELITTINTASDSITQRIENSNAIKSVFAKHVKDLEDSPIGSEVRNLRAARHRHERKALPTGRFVLFFDAILATANWMVANRQGEVEGKDAQRFLEYIDEEKYLAMALIADGSHEGFR